MAILKFFFVMSRFHPSGIDDCVEITVQNNFNYASRPTKTERIDFETLLTRSASKLMNAFRVSVGTVVEIYIYEVVFTFYLSWPERK